MDDALMRFAEDRAPQHSHVGQKRHVVSQGGGDVLRQRTQSVSTGSHERVPFQAIAVQQSCAPAPVCLRPGLRVCVESGSTTVTVISAASNSFYATLPPSHLYILCDCKVLIEFMKVVLLCSWINC